MENQIEKLQESKEKLKSLQEQKEQLIKDAAEVLIEAFKEHQEDNADVSSITIYYDYKREQLQGIVSIENLNKEISFKNNKRIQL